MIKNYEEENPEKVPMDKRQTGLEKSYAKIERQMRFMKKQCAVDEKLHGIFKEENQHKLKM